MKSNLECSSCEIKLNVYLVIDLPLIAHKFNVYSVHMKANYTASQQMIFVTANFNLHT